MVSTEQVIVMVTGIVFATLGIVLFAYFRLKAPPAETEIGVWKVQLKTLSPSLVVFIVGSIMIMAPFTFFKEQAPEQGFFEETLGGEVPETGPSSYGDFVTVYDDSNSIFADVPTDWTDRLGTAWLFESEEVGPAISASEDLDDFQTTWSEPGMFFGASIGLIETEDVDSMLDHYYSAYSGSCDYEGRDYYDDGVYVGKFDLWSDCGGIGTVVVEISATPYDGSFITYLEIVIVSNADLEALDKIIATFHVTEAFEDEWSG